MFAVKRDQKRWNWPKTILDFAASLDLSREQLDEIMNMTVSMFGARDPRVGLQSEFVSLTPGETCEVQLLTFQASLPPDDHYDDRDLHYGNCDWCEALGSIIDESLPTSRWLRLSLILEGRH